MRCVCVCVSFVRSTRGVRAQMLKEKGKHMIVWTFMCAKTRRFFKKSDFVDKCACHPVTCTPNKTSGWTQRSYIWISNIDRMMHRVNQDIEDAIDAYISQFHLCPASASAVESKCVTLTTRPGYHARPGHKMKRVWVFSFHTHGWFGKFLLRWLQNKIVMRAQRRPSTPAKCLLARTTAPTPNAGANCSDCISATASCEGGYRCGRHSGLDFVTVKLRLESTRGSKFTIECYERNAILS